MRMMHTQARAYLNTFVVIELATAVTRKCAMKAMNSRSKMETEYEWYSERVRQREWVNELFIPCMQEIKVNRFLPSPCSQYLSLFFSPFSSLYFILLNVFACACACVYVNVIRLFSSVSVY